MPQLPYLPPAPNAVSKTAKGVNDPTNEVARSPEQSSHYASGARTQLMKNLGLKESGFFADWRKRTYSPSYDAGSEAPVEDTTDTNLQGPSLRPYGETSINPQLPGKPYGKGAPIGPLPQQQPGGSATGLTRWQLHEGELGLVWNEMRGQIAKNPIMSTGLVDTVQSSQINMDRQVAMDMTAHPMELLGQALIKYYMKPSPATEQTNFEKIVSQYGETKNIAKKNINYAGAEMGKKIAELQKNPTFPGAENMLNVGSRAYNPTYYTPPL